MIWDALTAIGTLALAVATFVTLQVTVHQARRERLRLGRPVFDGQVTLLAGGAQIFTISLRLLSSEPLASLRVVLEGANAADCPLGFFPGVAGVEAIGRGDLPAGWENETVRTDAHWRSVLLPGATAKWRANPRRDGRDMVEVPAELHGRVECTGLNDERWTVYATFTMEGNAGAAIKRLGDVW